MVIKVYFLWGTIVKKTATGEDYEALFKDRELVVILDQYHHKFQKWHLHVWKVSPSAASGGKSRAGRTRTLCSPSVSTRLGTPEAPHAR